MELLFCINVNSFPANSTESAKLLFNDALQGVLQIVGGNERIHFYLETNNNINLYDLELAHGFTYENFIEDTYDVDLQSFLYEVEDKSPAIDTLTVEQQDEIMRVQFYVAGRAVGEDDVYALAWVIDAYLLSLATEDNWKNHEIRINKLGENGQYDDYLLLKNISNKEHGKIYFRQDRAENLANILDPHSFTYQFEEWFNKQTKENKRIIKNKLKLAIIKQFQGGKPLFEPLKNGFKEIRMSAFAGGAIRILFKHLRGDNHLVILGFIKHSNNEGYKQKIPEAENLYNSFIS